MIGRVAYRALWIILIGFFWLGLVAAFLYAPYVTRLLHVGQRSISIFVWSDIIDSHIISEFEQQAGIKVFVNYYESNDELLTKLRFAHGTGYDLFIPSHYMVKTLARDGLIKKIDKEKLEFWHEIDPRFLALAHDERNVYTIPYIWEVYGIGFDKRFFADKKFEPSWRMLFEPPVPYRVGMTNEPREVIDIASLYLYGSMKWLNNKKHIEISRLLMRQKQYVEAYTDLATDYLLTSGVCQVVLASGSVVYRARKQADWVSFVLPREGTVMSLENIVIAAKSTKDDLVYTFINFLFKGDAIKKTCDRYGYLPVLTRELEALQIDHLDKKFLLGSYFKTIQLIAPLMPRHELFDFWISLKAY